MEILTVLDSLGRHPAVVALLSVSAGTWLFGQFSYRRSRRDTMRQQALEFIDEISVAINAAISLLHRHNRDRQLLPSREQ